MKPKTKRKGRSKVFTVRGLSLDQRIGIMIVAWKASNPRKTVPTQRRAGMSEEIPNCPEVIGCGCYGDGRMPCVCGQTEKALRQWVVGVLPPMTPEQREWCYNEIDSVEAHDRADYENGSDAELAHGVLNAWQDYCRDKGLIS